jgi:REP element-mobilizing transposase RayT
LEHGTYYAVQNGATQRAVFANEADYATFERMLADLVADHALELHAYCLLPDCFHLALTLTQGTVARLMQRLTARYARHVQHTPGHFFRQRYRAVLIDPDEYLLPLVRYLHELPVRRARCQRPSDHAHSSDSVYRRTRSAQWIAQVRVRGQLRRLQISYEDWMRSTAHAVDETLFTSGARTLGSDDFMRDLPRSIGMANARRRLTIEQLIHDVALALDISASDLPTRARSRDLVLARALIAWLAVEHKLGSLSDIARRFNRDVSTLSKSIAHYRKRRPELFRLDVLRHLAPLAST